MKNQRKISLIIAAMILSVAIVACKKKENKPEPAPADTDTSVAAENSLVDAAFNDVQNISDQAARGTLVFYSPTYDGNNHMEESFEKTSCATITHDSISIPHILTIDFGTTNCMCNDGKNRRGIINVSYTGSYRATGSVHSITFTDYFVNDNQLLGTKTVTNNGLNTNSNLTFTIVIDGQLIKANNGGTHSWQSNRVREWLEGASTITWADDVYSITGSANGTAVNGNTYTAVITTALHRALNCSWFDSGVLEITPANKPVRIINYGSGACDSNATVTILGNTYPFTM